MRAALPRSGARAALLCSALAAVACGAEPAPAALASRPRNAILISIDTLRPDFLGCYGHARETSPTLDALAARGVRCDDASSAAPWTLPSHASLLTGLYPSRHGVKSHETRLPLALDTLADDLAAGGWRTLGVVNTWNVGAPQFQLSQGFERFHYEPETREDERTLRMRTVNGAREVLARARAFLEEGPAAGDERPFFLFLHFYDAHTDFTPRAEYRERFVEPYDGRLNGTTQQLVKLRAEGATLGADDLRWLRQMYEAEIRQLDDALGRFLAWLDERGWLADTLVVVTSDHGEEFQEHGGFLHGRTHYQEVLRVPLLLAGPGVAAGTVLATPVHGIDVAPTILALLGCPSRAPHDGLDLSALWRGGALPERALFAEADHTNVVDGQSLLDIKRMVRRGPEKLLFDRHSGARALHDLGLDPGELRDLVPERPARAQALLEELERFEAGAQAPEAIPAPTAEEQALLDELGYGGGDEDE
jgi:arylsulfatase A-like enzyme